jgi:hypothetical protein
VIEVEVVKIVDDRRFPTVHIKIIIAIILTLISTHLLNYFNLIYKKLVGCRKWLLYVMVVEIYHLVTYSIYLPCIMGSA